MNYNKAFLAGRIKELKVNPGKDGKPIANFTLVTTSEWTDKEGTPKKTDSYHKVAAFGQPAAFLEKTAKDGMNVFVEGRVQNRSYDDKQGVKKYVTEIMASTVHLFKDDAAF